MKAEPQKRIHIFALLVGIAIPLLVGCFSAFLTMEDMKVYESMNLPPMSPPGWVFPIAWLILYAMMGVASYFVYTSDAEPERKRKALRYYAAQLGMNLFWPILFFTYTRYLIALIWLLAMWILILICGIRFFRIRRIAGLLIGVLFLWTTYAAYLNLACYILYRKPMPLI